MEDWAPVGIFEVAMNAACTGRFERNKWYCASLLSSDIACE